MPVTSVDKDYDALTLTVVADFDAPRERVWQMWADPRLLEKWWGPPTYPATFERHEFTQGGSVTYYMTSPEGEKYHGWWRIGVVEPPSRLEFADGFADQDGKPVDTMPVASISMQLTESDGQTRMEMRSLYSSRDQLEKVVEMGAEEGIRQSVGQIDALLATPHPS